MAATPSTAHASGKKGGQGVVLCAHCHEAHHHPLKCQAKLEAAAAAVENCVQRHGRAGAVAPVGQEEDYVSRLEVITSTLAGSGQSDHEVRRFRPSLLRSHVEGVEGRHLFNLNR